MHTVIINGSPRSNAKSNTKIILNSFIQGYTLENNTFEIYDVANREQWNEAKEAFYTNENILIATPLFAESIPGILMEFLESLLPVQPNDKQQTLSFILQSGLYEGCQRRCCEEYLRKLSKFLGCEFGGVLSKGDMFVNFLLDSEKSAELTKPFAEMGKYYAENQCLIGDKVEAFRDIEYMSEKQAKTWNRITKFAMYEFAETFGCKTDLLGRPYDAQK